MATGDILKKWSSWTTLDLTNLSALPTSSTYVNGWESEPIDVNTPGYDDVEITIKITLGTTLTAAQIRAWLIPMLDGTNYIPNLDGTHSTEAPIFVDTEMQAAFPPAKVIDTDTTNSDIYYMHIPSVKAHFEGNMPSKFSMVIAHATNANLATLSGSNHQIAWRGSYYQIQS